MGSFELAWEDQARPIHCQALRSLASTPWMSHMRMDPWTTRKCETSPWRCCCHEQAARSAAAKNQNPDAARQHRARFWRGVGARFCLLCALFLGGNQCRASILHKQQTASRTYKQLLEGRNSYTLRGRLSSSAFWVFSQLVTFHALIHHLFCRSCWALWLCK